MKHGILVKVSTGLRQPFVLAKSLRAPDLLVRASHFLFRADKIWFRAAIFRPVRQKFASRTRFFGSCGQTSYPCADFPACAPVFPFRATIIQSVRAILCSVRANCPFVRQFSHLCAHFSSCVGKIYVFEGFWRHALSKSFNAVGIFRQTHFQNSKFLFYPIHRFASIFPVFISCSNVARASKRFYIHSFDRDAAVIRAVFIYSVKIA